MRAALRSCWMLALSFITLTAHAVDPDTPLERLSRQTWGIQEGVPPFSTHPTITTNGYLWLASGTGVHRFDGVAFEPASESMGVPRGRVADFIAAGPDGALWIASRAHGIDVVRGREAQRFDTRQGLVRNQVIFDFAFGAGGGTWLASSSGLYELRQQQWHRVASTVLGERAINSVTMDRNGVLWIVAENRLFYRLPDGRIEELASRDTAIPIEAHFSEAPDGTIWLARSGGDQNLCRVERMRLGRCWSFPQLRRIAFDRQGGIWGGYLHGLLRIARPDRLMGVAADQGMSVAEAERSLDTNSVLVDGHDQVWVAGDNGLTRFRDRRIARAATAFGGLAAGDGNEIWAGSYTRGLMRIGDAREAPANASSPAAYRAEDGTIWLEPRGKFNRWKSDDFRFMPLPLDAIRGQAVVLDRYADAGLRLVRVDRDRTGRIWAAAFTPPALVRQSGERFELQDLPPVSTSVLIRGIGVDSRGDVWLGVARNGTTPLYRRHGDTWHAYSSDLTLASMLVDRTDKVWVGTSDNRIAVFSNEKWRIFEAAEGLLLGATRTLTEGNGVIWAGGAMGVAAIVNERVWPLTTVGGHSIVGVTGMAAGENGELWINGTQGITRISAEEVQAFLNDPRREVTFLRLGFRDGVEGFATQGGPYPSLVRSAGDGRIWFATSGGLYWIDPAKLEPSTAPRSFITAVIAEDRPYAIAPAIALPMRTRRVQVRFGAPELVSPEKMMFRYRLNGVDAQWRNAGTERSATYTNLDPGSYEFEVVASNDHGEWLGETARLQFSIEPAFVQTRTFVVLITLVAAALLALLYYARLRQISRRIAAESNARHAERERIARDLHDTLLQAMQGLILRLHAKVSRPSSAEQLREQIAADLDTAEELLQEGRDRVHDLAVDPIDMPQLIGAFERFGTRLAEGSQTRFTVESTGEPRRLQAGMHRELLQIVHEAIGNAFKHAAATDIRVLVEFNGAGLEITVVDDGQGIPASVLAQQGRPGHLGMRSMAQRAALIGAELSIVNTSAGGACVRIRLPRTAYVRDRKLR